MHTSSMDSPSARRRIVFATNNAHKLQEIREILGEDFDIVSLADIGCHADIPETGQTLEENALQKARYVFEHFGTDCFADDTGLEVDALGGQPGVHSARYAEGTDHDSEANMSRLLRELGENNNRKARFRTVIALIQQQAGRQDAQSGAVKVTEFEGIVDGHIARERRGEEGFGYDPIFIPDGYDESFAQLGEAVKNRISHRARAVAQLAAYLKNT